MFRLRPALGFSLAAFLLALAVHRGLVSAGDPPAVPGVESEAKPEPSETAAKLEGFEPESTATESADAVDGDDGLGNLFKVDSEAGDEPAASSAQSDEDKAESEAPSPAADKPVAKADKPSGQQPTPPPGPHRPSAAPSGSTASPGRPKAGAKFSLTYKFKPGEAIRWEVVHRAVVDTTIQGTNQTAETRSTSVKAWQVTDVSGDGKVTLVHSVESIDMWQKMQGRQEVRYNSRTDDKVPAGYEDIAKAVGVPLTVVTLDAHGTVLKREEKHRQSNASNMPLAISLPAEPVAVGHTWNVPADVEVILHGGATRKIQTQQKFVLENVIGNLAIIAMETQVLTPITDPAIEAQLVQRYTNGTLRFDMELGRVVSQQLDLDKRVVGFSGASSSMHYLTRFTEELLTENSPVAYKKPPTKAPAVMTARPTPPAPPVTAKGPRPRARPAQR